MPTRFVRKIVALFALTLSLVATTATAQDDAAGREQLELAAAAMGGRDRLEALDNVVLTGFGQRAYHDGGGLITAEENAPPKWQSVTDAQRTFDLAGRRALNQERRSFQFPFAGMFGLDFARNSTVQTGEQLLDHPLTALLAALDEETTLGDIALEDGMLVIEFRPHGAASPAWIGLDPQSRLPRFTRWTAPHPNLGEVTTTAWFTGYAPFEGVYLPMGLMNRIDWRDTVTLMFQVDSYRVDVPRTQLPEFPAATQAGPQTRATAQVMSLFDGVWDVRVGTSGGAVMEFADRLVMFEAYGGEAQTLARIDAANALVPGKRVEAVIVSHHHFDHTGGLRAAISRGLEVIAHRSNEALFRELAARPAPHFPDALARNPQPLHFTPVDDTLVLEDAERRLEVYRVIGHAHMPYALFAYLPAERMTLEGDFGDEAWQLHWWGAALARNIAYRGIDPLTDLSVHGTGPLSIEQSLANHAAQVEAAQQFCRETEAGGRYVFGCPVQYDASGVLPLEGR